MTPRVCAGGVFLRGFSKSDFFRFFCLVRTRFEKNDFGEFNHHYIINPKPAAKIYFFYSRIVFGDFYVSFLDRFFDHFCAGVGRRFWRCFHLFDPKKQVSAISKPWVHNSYCEHCVLIFSVGFNSFWGCFGTSQCWFLEFCVFLLELGSGFSGCFWFCSLFGAFLFLSRFSWA